MNNNKLQALIACKLGDGCLKKQSGTGTHLQFSSIHKENCEFRLKMLNNKAKITKTWNKGYKEAWIYKFRTKIDKDYDLIYDMHLNALLSNLNKLGLAMWFYDDGSLHKTDLNYNLNTQGFTKEEHKKSLIPFFKSIGLFPKLRKDKKYYYLGFNKRQNAVWINDLLKKYLIKEMSYKTYPNDSTLKGFNYKEKTVISLKNLESEFNLTRNQVLNLRSKRLIKEVNYFEYQRTLKPSFWK